jgi:hypothetical protein
MAPYFLGARPSKNGLVAPANAANAVPKTNFMMLGRAPASYCKAV